MKYATEIHRSIGNHSAEASRACPSGLMSHREEHAAAFSLLQSATLALDGSRLFNLLEECRLRYGRLAREHAWATLRRWHIGHAALADDAIGHLFTLLPHHLTPEEKLTLFRSLWQHWIAELPRTLVSTTVRRGDDLLLIARRLAGSVRQIQETTLPTELRAMEDWIMGADAPALGAMALGTERRLAAHRLAAVMVQLTTLARLHALASPQVTIRVQARLEVPTLTVNLRFQPCFWRVTSLRDETDSGRTLLVRLQDMALRQTKGADVQGFVTHVLDGLTTTERDRLQALAAAEGLRTESLLRELQAQTLAARDDIVTTAATVERMQAGRLHGRVVSEHTLSCGAVRIEIWNGGCPLTRLIPFLA